MTSKQPLHDQTSYSPLYEALLKAGPRLTSLQQVHAHLIASGYGRSRALLTKLITQACAAGSIVYTRQLFFSVPNPDSFLFNSLIKSSSKFHFPLDSVLFYRRMILSNFSPSNYTFTSVIKACASLSALKLGRGVHCHVLVNGYGLDLYVQAALVAFYAKCGDLVVARKVFDVMTERSVVAWNSMISGYEQNGFSKEAIGLFYLMRETGFEMDSTTFVSVLSACAQLGAIGLGSWVHEYVVGNGFDVNVVLGTALINMYARCGNVSKAREVFDSMNERNVVAWTAMISGYGMHGYGSQAVELLHQMRACGVRPNSVTFVAVLSACAHAGLVHKGRQVFVSMKQEYGLVPTEEHYVCMVDVLGRAGLLNDAYRFIKELIPEEPGPAVWTAMLGSCKMHKNFDLGVQVAEHLLSVEPQNPGHYVMLSNIYALAGRMDRVELVRNIMIRKRLKKNVGYSTIEVDQRTYLFSMGDKSHPKTNELYQYLDELMCKCREAGYVPAPESVMHELEEEEKEYALRYHSEKLAIAFGLMKTSQGIPIRIVKNLRMCEDCHSAIKYISVVTNREIIVRDKLRFHHFKDGLCSCMDYW
ncbi:PPR domain-containing protein/PPR_2 domain-containing protein/DYW_deaminase domain-containing protein [Cephalotus follicularis]|uniref:PPR domain-containing protein/PPR_2 domain-containing protein/DYW_deaminase domain-containing protein n=1 Tax=Cephalotus follicularis TaxID=3775 RepID=A0A1Q3D7X9_CEPFO|nr:PPR domain-containing protein/PPR_2 domain-containing protein/DYW_deaminase domain-containing protein [Cephalotus follicularis]